MTFASIIVLLTALAQTAQTILHDISTGSVNLGTGTIPDLKEACVRIISFDGEVCGPTVPARIKENLPVYESAVKSMSVGLAGLIFANVSAFPPATQDLLMADLRRHEALVTDRYAR